MIASGSGDGRIRLWDSVTGACKASLGDTVGPQEGVTSVVLRQARIWPGGVRRRVGSGGVLGFSRIFKGFHKPTNMPLE